MDPPLFDGDEMAWQALHWNFWFKYTIYVIEVKPGRPIEFVENIFLDLYSQTFLLYSV